MVAQRAVVQYLVSFLEIAYSHVAEVNVGFVSPLSQLASILVHIFEIVVELGIFCDPISKLLSFTTSLSFGSPLFSDHIFNAHIFILFNLASLSATFVLHCFNLVTWSRG